jgi:membrane-associated phospholipid phosphatase
VSAWVAGLTLALLAQTAPPKLTWEPKVDLPLTSVLVAGWVTSEFALKPALAPQACRWCQPNGFDTAVRRLFNPELVPSSFGRPGPDTASNVLAFGALPLLMVGLDALQAWQTQALADDFPVDLVLMLESTFSALAVNQTVKFAVGRARPYTVGEDPVLLAQAKDPHDHELSFFSGHSTFSFGLAVSAGTIATLRQYKLAWLTWDVGLPLAATTAVLRLAADKHWASDVLVGTAMGSLAGALMPLFLHGPEAPRVTLAPMPNGLAVSGRF